VIAPGPFNELSLLLEFARKNGATALCYLPPKTSATAWLPEEVCLVWPPKAAHKMAKHVADHSPNHLFAGVTFRTSTTFRFGRFSPATITEDW